MRNVLFNFISQYKSQIHLSQLAGCIKISTNKDKNQTPYHCIDLTLPKNKTMIGSYKLTAHHISIYENEDLKLPHLSQYHYTAYFEDDFGLNYSLHVYYNNKGELAKEPVLTMIENKKAQIINSSDFHPQFVALSELSLNNIISSLRIQQNTIVTNLQKSYLELEAETSALSIKLDSNYLAKLQEMIKALDELIDLTNHKHYIQIQILLKQMVEAVSNEIANGNLSKEAPSSQIEIEELPLKTESTPPSTTQKSEKPVASVAKALEEIRQQFAKIMQAEETARAPLLSNLIKQLTGLELINNQIPLNELQEIQKLQIAFQRAGESLFNRLILDNQLDAAKNLDAFYHLLPHYLPMALNTANAMLLSFIIEYSELDINTYPVVAKGNHYLTAIHYCFAQPADKQPSLVDCLDILVKKGSSLLFTDEQGLPFAHHLISTRKHPLRAVYDENIMLLSSGSFYKKMVILLEFYLNQNPSQKEKIKPFIHQYNAQKTEQKALSHLPKATARSLNKQILEIRKLLLEQPYLQAMLMDEDIADAKIKLEEIFNKFCNLLNEKEIAELGRNIKTIISTQKTGLKTLETANNSLNLLDSSLEEEEKNNISTQQMKEAVTYQPSKENILSYLDKCFQIFEIKIKLKTNPAKNAKQMRAQQQLLTKIKKLEQEAASLLAPNPEQILTNLVDIMSSSMASLSQMINELRELHEENRANVASSSFAPT